MHFKNWIILDSSGLFPITHYPLLSKIIHCPDCFLYKAMFRTGKSRISKPVCLYLVQFVIPAFSIRHSGSGRKPGRTFIQREAQHTVFKEDSWMSLRMVIPYP